MNKLLMNKRIINIINKTEDIDLQLDSNEMVIINYFGGTINNLNINIMQKENSYFVLNYSGYINSNSLINFNANILGNNNKCIVNMRIIAEENEGHFNINVRASKNTINNVIVEDLKGINENGTIIFTPVLEIDTNEVDASHYATIGGLDQNQLFYLQSKGISLKSACELLKRSFIYNLFSNEFISMLNGRKEKDE